MDKIRNYDQAKRRVEVLDKVDKILKEFNTKDLLTKSDSNKDIITKYIEHISWEVTKLEKEVDDFNSQDSRQHQILQGECSQLQLKLDEINVSGRDEIRTKRRAELLKIDDISKKLAFKLPSQ